ncbi:dehydrogenase/reductase SDR family member 7 [Lucilia cuprina]|uniref:dehydrogenase/reductase SDR family member 7 n=1 Tax=Lucilia cuprina TaxID=7375 RepID=UPI001F05D030|nr:dehydrogenase/reductase SDR family member 7 [Lucilia cuprina]
MNFFEILGFTVLIYCVIYFLLWIFLDCNVALWLKIRFGVHISTLRGQVVWITGASSGIGKGLALNLARHGVRLVLSARREALLEEVKEECLAEAKGLLAAKDVLVLPMDMLKLETHNRCLLEVLNYFGKLDILVNNAGRSQRANWEDIDIQVDRELFELDVFSVLHLSRLVVHYFLEQAGGKGHIAATSSVAGLTTVPFSASYCGAKHALNAYLQCLAMEHPSLDITIFNPGPVATDFLQEAFTAKPNSKVGQSTKNQKRLTADRCGFLFATALANKMELVWCGLFPVNFLAYVSRYTLLSAILKQFMTQNTLNKIREGKI